jgi:hypothetical protein
MTEEKPQVKVDKPDWQVTIWKYFLDVKDIVVVKIKLGTALILLYTAVIFFCGWLVGNHGKTSDVLYAVGWVYKNNPAIKMETLGTSFCMDHGNYYEVKKTSNWTFQITKRQQPQTDHIQD